MRGRLTCFLALSALLLAPVASQDRSTERFDVALGLIKRGMHDDAARQLARFVGEHPRHDKVEEAYYRLGNCYLELNDEKQAITAFRKAIGGDKFKLRAECRYRLGHTLMQSGDARGAAEQFGALVAEGGDAHYLAAPSYYAQGECLRKLEQFGPALAAYTSAAALDKDKSGRFAASSLYQAGFIQMQAKQYAAAEKFFGSAADRFPKHKAYGECRFLQGEAALRGKRYSQARKAFERAVRAGGEFADDAAMGLGYCSVAENRTGPAVDSFRRVAKQYPKSPLVPKAWLEAGRVLFGAKQHAAAEVQLKDLLSSQSAPADVRWPGFELRGLARLELRRPKEAAADLRQAIQLAKAAADKGRMLYSLGEAYADAEDWKNALASYGRCHAATKSADLKGDALYGQSLALHRLGRFKDSNDVVVSFLKDNPQHRLRVVATFAGAENLFALKDYKAADSAYGQIPLDHELAGKAAFKRAWCGYLSGDFKTGATRFAAVANSKAKAHASLAEEALSMEALSWFEGGSLLPALRAADRYRDRYADGSFLARTERVAARVLKRQNKLKAAASRLARAASVEKSGDVASGDKLEFAEVLFKQGDFEGAQKAYAALANRQDSVGGRAHEGLAWCAFELGDDKSCKDWIARGLQHDAIREGRAGLLELLSAVHHRGKEWADAEKVADRYISEFPDHARAPELLYSRGVARARNGKLEPARMDFEALRAVDMKRKDRIFYELAWVCRRLEDEPAAIRAFRETAATSKDEDMAGEACLHVGESLLAAKKVDAALSWLEKAKGRYAPRAQYVAGFTRFERKQYAPALKNFDNIVKLGAGADDPGDLYLEAQFFAGECLFRQNKYAPAVPRYQALLTKQPAHERSQVARLHQGQCQVHVKNAGPAAMVLEDYLRRAAAAKDNDAAKSDLARANLWLGKARKLQKDYQRAEAAFVRVTDLTDSDLSAEAQFRIGECRMERNELSAAVDSFVKLSILYQHATWVQRGLSTAGDCYVRLKKPKKAAKLYEELVQRFPKSDLAKTAQAKLKTLRSM